MLTIEQRRLYQWLRRNSRRETHRIGEYTWQFFYRLEGVEITVQCRNGTTLRLPFRVNDLRVTSHGELILRPPELGNERILVYDITGSDTNPFFETFPLIWY